MNFPGRGEGRAMHSNSGSRSRTQWRAHSHFPPWFQLTVSGGTEKQGLDSLENEPGIFHPQEKKKKARRGRRCSACPGLLLSRSQHQDHSCTPQQESPHPNPDQNIKSVMNNRTACSLPVPITGPDPSSKRGDALGQSDTENIGILTLT